MKPLFSICVIVKNEANTLPKLFASLKDFKKRKGEVCILDTGSTDDTIKIAKAWGAKVFEGKFSKRIDLKLAKNINDKFLEKKEPLIVMEGDMLFDFAAARNFINSKATSDMICTLDADEAYTRFDIDKINELIKEGFEQFEYQFVFAHDPSGRPAVQFVQSKFFNRTKAKWDGIVHEMVTGQTKKKYLDPSIIFLEHFQEPNKEHRSNYLPGLALDCFLNSNKDRQSHYFARELMYTNRPKSAIKEFKHHITMGGWPAEKGQSMIFIGRCYGMLNDPENQAAWLSKAFYTDPGRRAALIELALFFRHQNSFQGTAAYAGAALEIPWVDYYANERSHYENLPHELLYWAKGWMGDIKGAQEHILKALEYQPRNENYLRDTKFYFEYPDNGIDGWMQFAELTWLYEEAKKHKVIVEIGSWKGKSTHALCSGAKKGDGKVTAIDTWEGSEDVRDLTHDMAKKEDVYRVFKDNMKDFGNLNDLRMNSIAAAKKFKDGSIDFCFIDAGHTKEEVKADILAWLPKMKPDGIISGHDYSKETWMGVVEAVDEIFGKPDRIEGFSIWVVDLSKKYKVGDVYSFGDGTFKKNGIPIDSKELPPAEKPKTRSLLKPLTTLIKTGSNFSYTKLGDGEMVCMVEQPEGKVNCDGHKYSKELGGKLKSAYRYFASHNVMIGDRQDNLFNPALGTTWDQDKRIVFNKMPEFVSGDIFLNNVIDNDLKDFFKSVKISKRKKILVSPSRLGKAVEFLNIDSHIVVPLTNAYDDYEGIKKEVIEAAEQNAIFMFCAGFISKLLIHDLLKTNDKITCIDLGSSLDPVFGFKTRNDQLDTKTLRSFYKNLLPDESDEQYIPKHIYTAWLSDKPMPDNIKKCIESQKIQGYKHSLITLKDLGFKNPLRSSIYLDAAIRAKKWVKAKDYLMMQILRDNGGIFLDADVEILSGKNFDSLLSNQMFAAPEENELPAGVPGVPFIGYSVVGCVAGHPIAVAYTNEVNARFKGDDDFYFESSMEIFTKLVYNAEPGEVKLLPAETFYPYNHKTGEINVTDNTITFHHFLKSWKDTTDLLPTVSIIIPTLGRKEGLKKCLDSINRLYYPKHLIEINVIPGEGTVPQKMKKGVAATTGDLIVYGSNDIEFTPYSLYRAGKMTDKYSLVAFNTGQLLPDRGNICEHFIIKREFVKTIGGEIFDTRLHHVGVDNLLWAKASNLKQAARCEDAIVMHNHFSRGGKMDEVYEKGWSHVKEDRKKLKELMNG